MGPNAGTGDDRGDADAVPLRERLSRLVDDHVRTVMVGVPLLVLVAVFVYPLLWVLYKSLFVTIPGIPTRIDPLYNYGRVAADSAFYSSMGRTLLYAFGSFTLSFVGGLFFALVLHRVRQQWLRTTYLTVVALVLAIPVSIVAMLWGAILSGEPSALLNGVLIDLGLVREPVAFLRIEPLALPIVILVDAWLRMPLAVLVFLAGRQSIPEYLYEAARIDGATTFQAFRHVTLPRLRPYMATVVLLVWAFAFQAFSVIWVMTDGGPIYATRTVSLYLYEIGILYLDFGRGAAISTVLVAITLVVTAVYVRIFMDRG
ncbi:MAG: carbohydrate ABC transporter permease [Haloarculaceae archaeon]